MRNDDKKLAAVVGSSKSQRQARVKELIGKAVCIAVIHEVDDDQPLLASLERQGLCSDWLKEFGANYKVNRNIDKNRKVEAAELLVDCLVADLKKARSADEGASLVEGVAKLLKSSGFSMQAKGKKKEGEKEAGKKERSLPTSFVSKVAYLHRPELLSPIDGNGATAINNIFEIKRGTVNRRGVIKRDEYCRYVRKFDTLFAESEMLITELCKRPWVKQMAKKYGMSVEILGERWFHRKVLDKCLWQLGGNLGKNK